MYTLYAPKARPFHLHSVKLSNLSNAQTDPIQMRNAIPPQHNTDEQARWSVECEVESQCRWAMQCEPLLNVNIMITNQITTIQNTIHVMILTIKIWNTFLLVFFPSTAPKQYFLSKTEEWRKGGTGKVCGAGFRCVVSSFSQCFTWWIWCCWFPHVFVFYIGVMRFHDLFDVSV